MKRKFFVYILANKSNNVLYTGVTNNLRRRVYEHKAKKNKGFSSKYNVDKLVYYERYFSVIRAIKREKQIKNLVRRKKNEMIGRFNKDWNDLFTDL